MTKQVSFEDDNFALLEESEGLGAWVGFVFWEAAYDALLG